jgi:hypothetical protein
VIRWRRGRVVALGREWTGALEVQVAIGEPALGDLAEAAARAADSEDGVTVRALAYPELVGRPEPGDIVLLNTTALAMGLGTGGYAVIVAIPDRLPPDPTGAGHLVKDRYTPMQVTVAGADEQGSAHHDLLSDADSIDGMPVVIADLHSALPAITTTVLACRPGTRIAYVMTDGGALPLWFSRTVAALAAHNHLAGSITVGQAYGGDLEAVTVHTGLLAARHALGADLAVVTQGPGNLGTGTRWGFSGVQSGEAVNAAAVLGGRPVASLRISEADPRDRHRGVSHHSLTAYGRVALASADLVVPQLPGEFGAGVRRAAQTLAGRHRLVLEPTDELLGILSRSPVRLSTMGRGLDEDSAYFLGVAAAGRHAARLLTTQASQATNG